MTPEAVAGETISLCCRPDVFIGYPDGDPRTPYLLDGFGERVRLSDCLGSPWLEEKKGYAYFPRNSWTGKSLGPTIWCFDGGAEDQRGYAVERIRKDQDGVWVGYDEKLGDPEKQVWGWIKPEAGEIGPSKAEDRKKVKTKPGVGANNSSSGGTAAGSSWGGSSASDYLRRISTTPACSSCEDWRPWRSAELITCSLCKQTACKECRRFGSVATAPAVRECELCQIRICDPCNRPPVGQEQRNPIRFCDICDKAYCKECIPIER